MTQTQSQIIETETTTSAIEVSHTISAPLVVLAHGIVAEAAGLVEAAGHIEAVDADNLAAANEIAADLARLGKEIETQRKDIKAPVLKLGKAIDKAAKDVTDKLDKSKRALAGKIADHVRAIEAERRRIEAENRRKIEEAQAAAEASERARAEASKPGLLGRMLGRTEQEPEPEIARPIPVALEAVPDRVRSAVSVRKVKQLQILDETAIPMSLAGVRLWSVNEAAITKLLRAGVPVPGCELIEVEQTAVRS